MPITLSATMYPTSIHPEVMVLCQIVQSWTCEGWKNLFNAKAYVEVLRICLQGTGRYYYFAEKLKLNLFLCQSMSAWTQICLFVSHLPNKGWKYIRQYVIGPQISEGVGDPFAGHPMPCLECITKDVKVVSIKKSSSQALIWMPITAVLTEAQATMGEGWSYWRYYYDDVGTLYFLFCFHPLD